MVYAVIDTNVIVSALLSRNKDSATVRVIELLIQGRITPLFNEDILNEYTEVLLRPKFNFSPPLVHAYINAILKNGIKAERAYSGEYFSDPDDIVFYEIALSRDNSFLVTGNIKHFPTKPFVVTPAEMIAVINQS